MVPFRAASLSCGWKIAVRTQRCARESTAHACAWRRVFLPRTPLTNYCPCPPLPSTNPTGLENGLFLVRYAHDLEEDVFELLLAHQGAVLHYEISRDSEGESATDHLSGRWLCRSVGRSVCLSFCACACLFVRRESENILQEHVHDIFLTHTHRAPADAPATTGLFMVDGCPSAASWGQHLSLVIQHLRVDQESLPHMLTKPCPQPLSAENVMYESGPGGIYDVANPVRPSVDSLSNPIYDMPTQPQLVRVQ